MSTKDETLARIGKFLHRGINDNVRHILMEASSSQDRFTRLQAAHQILAHNLGMIEELMREMAPEFGENIDEEFARCREDGVLHTQAHGAS